MSEELPILVTRCLQGDEFSFSALIDRFKGQVYGLCYRMLGQREDAEDAMQETFVRVAKSLHQWDPERSFEPWLLTIAGNRCRTKLSKRKRRPVHFALEAPIADDSEKRSADGHMAEEIQLALSSIRKEYQEAFRLFHFAELGYSEIAERMNVPIGTVKTWVHRARKEVMLKLQQREVIVPLAKAKGK